VSTTGRGLLIGFTAEEGDVGVSAVVGLVASLVVGGAVGAAALVGVVNSQTSPPSKSPVSVSEPAIQYGSNS